MAKNVTSSKSLTNNTAQDFFHLLEQFAKLKKTECMNILILQTNVEELLGSNCGLFQLYFYENLFNPDEKSKILDREI